MTILMTKTGQQFDELGTVSWNCVMTSTYHDVSDIGYYLWFLCRYIDDFLCFELTFSQQT